MEPSKKDSPFFESFSSATFSTGLTLLLLIILKFLEYLCVDNKWDPRLVRGAYGLFLFFGFFAFFHYFGTAKEEIPKEKHTTVFSQD